MTTSYVGSTISLISRSGIRYVGILHSINSQDSTVALEQVRSYGTEGRRGNPAEEIPPSDSVFEYIVFRGSDVKDLQVFEPQAAPPQPQVPNDPAILGTTAPRVPYTHTPQIPASDSYSTTPYLTQQPDYPQYWQPPGFPGNQPQQVRTQTPITGESHLTEPKTAEPQRSLDVSSESSSKAEMTTAAVEQLAKKVSELGINGVESGRASQQNRLPGTGGYLQQQQNVRRGVRTGRGGRGGYNYDTRNQNRSLAVPGTDFDFESSNAKFNKEEIVKEVLKKDHHGQDNGQHEEVQEEVFQEPAEEEVVIPPPQEFYDRSKSFFDNISCEAKERSEGGGGEDRRTRSYQERKLNIETFGQTSIDQGRFRGGRSRPWRASRGTYNSRSGHSRGGYNGSFRGGYQSSFNRGQRSQQSNA